MPSRHPNFGIWTPQNIPIKHRWTAQKVYPPGSLGMSPPRIFLRWTKALFVALSRNPNLRKMPRSWAMGHVCWGRSTRFFKEYIARYIKSYYWVDDHPLPWGNNASFDPSTCDFCLQDFVSSTSATKKTAGSFPWNTGCLRGILRIVHNWVV